jgi:hypothetical protein
MMTIDQERIWLRVKVPGAEDGTAVMEMTDPVVPENGLQAFGAGCWPRLSSARTALQRPRAVWSPRRGNGAGRAATCWPISSRRGWEAVWYGISALFRWIWTSWPASSTSPGIRRSDSGSRDGRVGGAAS